MGISIGIGVSVINKNIAVCINIYIAAVYICVGLE